MHKIVRISVIGAVLLLALIALAAAQNGQTIAFGGGGYGVPATLGATARIVGGDEASVRVLLAHIVGGSPYPNQESVVYVGSLPDKLPFDLSLPDDAHVIGSVVYGTPGYTQIILDSTQPPDKIVSYFQDSLKTADWKTLENYPTGGGFVSQPQAGANFCYKNDQVLLSVNAQTGDNATNVLLYINVPADGFACGGASEAAGPGEPYTLLPQLKTPEGVELLPQSGGGGGSSGGPGYRSASVSAYLGSKLSISDIADAYNQQLRDAGWEAVRSESGENMAFSGWTLKDKEGNPWAGTFLLTANPTADDEYNAQVIIQEIAKP